MSEHRALSTKDKDFYIKPFLSQHKKVAGRIVEEELEIPQFGDEEVGDLLDGITTEEVDDGREKLLTDSPQLASKQIHEMLDEAADSFDTEELGQEMADPKRVAGTKRVGMIMDRDSEQTLDFKRINAGAQVELTDDSGEVLDTLSNIEFDNLLDSGNFITL